MAVIGVMGSGSEEWREFAEPLGRWIAEGGHDLLTGGGRGVMLSCARAFAAVPGRTGRSIGILPTEPHPSLGFRPLEGYPNPYVDLPILTPLPRKLPDAPEAALSRNHVNVLSSDVVIALPGKHGTLDEIRLALRFGKPLLCFGPRDAFAEAPREAPVAVALEDVRAFIGRVLAGGGASAGIPA